MSGYQALCSSTGKMTDIISVQIPFIEEMRAIQFTGSCQCAYHYVALFSEMVMISC